MILWLFISKRWRDILRLFSPVGIIIFLLISCPWIILVQKANKDFLWFFFIQEHFLRYTTTLHGRNQIYFVLCSRRPIGNPALVCLFIESIKGRGRKKSPSLQGDRKHFLLIWIDLHLYFLLLFFIQTDPLHCPHLFTHCRYLRSSF